MKAILISAAAVALTAACAPVTKGVEPLALSPDLAQGSHIRWITMSSAWLEVDEEFGDTFTDALRADLDACAKGPRPLNLNVHVTKVERDGRMQAFARGWGEHELHAIAELVEPGTRRIVGRYPIHVKVDAGTPAQMLLGDRQLMVSDAFATELCRQAFAG